MNRDWLRASLLLSRTFLGVVPNSIFVSAQKIPQHALPGNQRGNCVQLEFASMKTASRLKA